jgi:hypothetical protein
VFTGFRPSFKKKIRMNNKVAEAKIRLKNIIEKYEKQKSIHFTEKIITINAEKENLWVTIFLICFLIILPILCIIYLIYFERCNILIGISAILLIPFWNLLKEVFIGETELEINFTEKYLLVKNINTVLGRFYKIHKIKFSDIYKSELKVNSFNGEYTTIEWIRLFLIDKKGKKIVLANFDNELPDTLIANEVNIIIGLIKN